MQIIDERLAKRLEAYTEAGGVVIFSFRAGIKDRSNNLYFSEIPPCKIQELCGIEIESSESLGKNTKVPIVINNGLSAVYQAGVWRDLIRPTTAKTPFKYDDQFFKDYSAVTENTYAKGKVYYLGCGLEADAVTGLTKKLLKRHYIRHIESPEGVEIVIRGRDKKQICFIMNHNACEVTYNDRVLKAYEVIIEGVVE